jgi:hypothetical protein
MIVGALVLVEVTAGIIAADDHAPVAVTGSAGLIARRGRCSRCRISFRGHLCVTIERYRARLKGFGDKPSAGFPAIPPAGKDFTLPAIARDLPTGLPTL